ncbi:MAG: hypothetical protein H6Q02_1031, partial [Acidobacteria bacterium]|nr:hypothetical protein [Acidobacteriota bacterium]
MSPKTSANPFLRLLPPLAAAFVVAGLLLGVAPAGAQGENLCVGKVPDGNLQPGEQCDDGNLVNEDGCNNYCGLGTCVDDLTGQINNCTANDVRLSVVVNHQSIACELNDPAGVDVELIGGLIAGASERYDIGMFIATDGGDAGLGECYHEYLQPPLAPEPPDCTSPAYIPGSLVLNPDGSVLSFTPGGPFFNAECDEDPLDTCGDLEQGVVTVYDFPETVNIPCQDNAGYCRDSLQPCLVVSGGTGAGCSGTDVCQPDGKVDFGSCVSWDNLKDQDPSCIDLEMALPNTKAKCRCETLNIGNVYVMPTVELTKECDELSKVGDTIDCTVTITNTSDSPNALPLHLDSFTDSLVDPVTVPAACDELSTGESCTITYSYLVPAEAPDPLHNTATAHFHPGSLTARDVVAEDSWDTNLFQPSVDVEKTCDALSKVGDTISCTVTIENTSSSDSPALILDSFTDTLVAGATPPAACSPLAVGGSCSFSYTYEVPEGAADPLENTAEAHYHPEGFPNDVEDSDTWSTDLFQPSI